MNAKQMKRQRYLVGREARRRNGLYDSENAQAEREVLSARHRDDDPEPGAFYGHTNNTDTEPEPTHA